MISQVLNRVLRDCSRVVREQFFVIVLLVAITGGTAFVISKAQKSKYESTASINFREETRDLGLLGQWIQPTIIPFQLAVQNALTIKRDTVVLGALRRLAGSGLTAKDLRDADISPLVDPASNLVQLVVRDAEPERAAQIANAFAAQATAESNAASRRRFNAAATDLRRQIRSLRPEQGTERFVYTIQLTRLQTLAEFNVSAELTARAAPASSPVYPRTIRNTILGLIAGLVLGLLAGFVRDALDRRPRSMSDVTAALHLPLLGSVRGAVLGRALSGRAKRWGPEDFEAARLMRLNLELIDVDTPPRVVAVTSAMPEEGKSTTAASLAMAAASAERHTLLLECDLRRPSLARRLDVQPTPGLTDVLQGDATLADAVQTTESGLAVLTAGSESADPGRLLASEQFASVLETLRDDYDLVVLDTAPLLPVVDTLELVPLVDGVVLCIRVDRTTREHASAAREALARFPSRPMGVVVTGISTHDEQVYGSYAGRYAYAPRAGAAT